MRRPDSSTAASSTFAAEVAALRPLLLRLARQRVRNAAWAEDAVSETLVAVLERPPACADHVPTKSWVVGILKHKLVDQIRRHTRECQWAGSDDDESESDPFDDALAACQAPWSDPQASLAQREFIAQVDHCVKALPSQQGRAFVLRDCMEADTDEVCRELGVSANHLGVLLHRARARLRTALSMPASPALQFA
jgi:RNA polymerase sigma-70 factor, ECF subfamily